ncbi:MAG TPA: ATP synthase F1 subunit epsilon [bacterium]|jgi:F-type H+-transporting ATPase subunit epsilon|nr:MAG: ATP synthase epsilon chain [Parcubacteria group bacterium ADurb.Bin115]HNU81269.1 ATP synthase F1 subunit epsilon [bacterium]HRS23173.1 ATP synthase F1 subunit epsilon [Candidatus Woesebacteria bacterium]HOD86913.1 ATP synthase F1 subunit epsilon [bacterium]HPW05547.1 ATP synthase F1 subunit epsilon [bacterium]
MADRKIIKFEIVTPERTVFKQEVFQVTVPTQSGEITVLPDHIPLVSILKPGVLEIKTVDQETEIISVSGGFIEVLRDKIVILADTAERAQELDENIIAEARRRAEVSKEEAMSQDNYDLSAVAAKLEIEVARERALHKWRKLKNIK